MNKLKRRLALLPVVMLASIQANAEYDIGETQDANGFIGLLEDLMQQWVNFSTGPAAIWITLTSLLIGGGMWALAPKAGGLSYVMRGGVVGLGALNIPAVMSMF